MSIETEDSLWRWPLATFRDTLASDSPTPGGGSAAMVSATFGLGLVLMALRVTANKAADRTFLDTLILSGERLMAELSAHADADVAVFDAYMAALKLPKATEGEKAARRRALQEATIAATEIPLNAAQTTLEAIDLANQAATLAAPQIVSDVGAGAATLCGAVEAVLYAVDVNLRGLDDAARRQVYADSRDRLLAAAEQRAGGVARLVRDRLR
ncbi:cyclodeaminase/cyclohydrolase family protein [Inquilinus limosus]|uniref:cyclodeaminase/cyclohydrolase family protein n=1 Tax=Inquilinus limosus TaxID=171674 RepID=UPI000411363A|nr:cyclodeaminase/cyclohydrolase family protein [Inquilinus limosus]